MWVLLKNKTSISKMEGGWSPEWTSEFPYFGMAVDTSESLAISKEAIDAFMFNDELKDFINIVVERWKHGFGSRCFKNLSFDLNLEYGSICPLEDGYFTKNYVCGLKSLDRVLEHIDQRSRNRAENQAIYVIEVTHNLDGEVDSAKPLYVRYKGKNWTGAELEFESLRKFGEVYVDRSLY